MATKGKGGAAEKPDPVEKVQGVQKQVEEVSGILRENIGTARLCLRCSGLTAR